MSFGIVDIFGFLINPVLAAIWFGFALLIITGIIIVVRALKTAQAQAGSPAPASFLDRQIAKVKKAFSRFTPARRLMAVAGVAGGILMFVFTGWPLLLIVVPAAALWVPALLGGDAEKESLTKLEALEGWTRSLSSLTVAGASLEQTLTGSVMNASPMIVGSVRKLASRLKAQWSTSAALEMFANEIADPSVDVIVAHLMLAEKSRGNGLSHALDDLADIIGTEVRVRRTLFAERAKPRQNAKSIIIITLALIAFVPFAGSFTASYGTPIGQLILATWLGIYVVILMWLSKIMSIKSSPRFLTNTANGGTK